LRNSSDDVHYFGMNQLDFKQLIYYVLIVLIHPKASEYNCNLQRG